MRAHPEVERMTSVCPMVCATFLFSGGAGLVPDGCSRQICLVQLAVLVCSLGRCTDPRPGFSQPSLHTGVDHVLMW